MLFVSTARRRPPWMVAGAVVVLLMLAVGAGPDAATDVDAEAHPTLDLVFRQGDRAAQQVATWYRRTPPAERITWGGLIACGALGLVVTAERTWRLRRGRIVPPAFVSRFQSRLAEGRLDRAKGLDYCELNPSPAARVALAAIGRWGRPAVDLERGVALARGREVDGLRRHIGTLRRVAGLAPLLGLLGTLTAAGRLLRALGPASPAWGPALAGALGPLTAGVALAILALVAYDGLAGKVEALAGELDRLGAETVDAIVLTAASEPLRPAPRIDPVGPLRSPHAQRAEAAEPFED